MVFEPLGGRIGCCWLFSGDCASLLFVACLVGGSGCIVIIC